MDSSDLVDRVHSLSDLELAVLLSLISEEHCVIGTPEDAVDDVVEELCLISATIFGLRHVVVPCHDHTTLDEFTSSLLITPPSAGPTTAVARHNSQSDSHGRGYFHPSSAAPPSPQAAHAHGHTKPPKSPHSPLTFLMTPATAASGSASTSTTTGAPSRVANVVFAKHLNMAPEAVQIQALELLRSKRVVTRNGIQAAPKPFLFVAVVAAERGFRWGSNSSKTKDGSTVSSPYMTAHLNDFFAMAHWHDPGDGYPNLDLEEAEQPLEDASETDSIVKRSPSGARSRRGSTTSRTTTASRGNNHLSHRSGTRDHLAPFFSEADMNRLATMGRDARIDMDVLRYLMNVVAFLRIHRAVAVVSRDCSGCSSVSPTATRHFENLARCLAPLHRLDYVTPSLVALAARKVYLHRIRTLSSAGSPDSIQHERSMQWGSTKEAIGDLLDDISPEDVVEDVLVLVAPPI